MDYLLIFVGLILLALPTGLMNKERLKLLTLREIFEGRGPRKGYDFLHRTNLVDLARGFSGITFIQLALMDMDAVDRADPWVQGGLCGVALLSLLVQHGFYSMPRGELPAPVAFSLGLVIALVPFSVALLALPVGIVAALAVQNLGLGLVLTSTTTAVIGGLFDVPPIALGAASAVLLFSPLLSGVLRRPLALAVIRAGGRPGRPSRQREIPLKPPRR
ncbi:MAG: hypothetical protein EAZ36_04780 [Verrucomicrobia bacterium]|nr:MAG: hypothetical protein EAZ36_04780 [Verrucomicrobiota bacterium]